MGTNNENYENKDLIFEYDNQVYDIGGYIEDGSEKEYEAGKCYINKNDGKLYIYTNKEDTTQRYPTFTTYKSGTIKLTKSVVKHTNDDFNINNNENVKDYSTLHIVDASDVNDVLYDKKALDDINSATTIFKPTINDNDDSLKQVVKNSIIYKEVNTHKYKHVMSKRYNLTNLISNIKGPNPLTYRSFNIWAELLGLDFIILVKDNGSDTDDPLSKVISYTSSNNKVEVYDPDEIEVFAGDKKVF